MIWLTGDLHGGREFEKLSSENLEARKVSPGDYVFIAGDFGVIWNPTKTEEEQKMLKRLSSRGVIFIIVDGNHENFNRLFSAEFKTIPMFDDEVIKIAENVYLLKRGHIYNIDGKKVLAFGGGMSIDKIYRQENVSWWPQEIPNFEETKTLFDNLEKHNNKVDLIVTHATNETFYKKIFGNRSYKEKDPLHKILEEVKKRTRYDLWICGHYHVFATDYMNHCICLYNELLSYDEAKKIIDQRLPGVSV